MTTDTLEPISGFNKGDAVRLKDGSDTTVAHIEAIYDQKSTPGGVGLDRDLGGFRSWNVSELEIAPVEHYRAYQISTLSGAISAVANNASLPFISGVTVNLSKAAQGASRHAVSMIGASGARRAEALQYVQGVMDTIALMRPNVQGTDVPNIDTIEHDLVVALGMIGTALITESAVVLAASRSGVEQASNKLGKVAMVLKRGAA